MEFTDMVFQLGTKYSYFEQSFMLAKLTFPYSYHLSTPMFF